MCKWNPRQTFSFHRTDHGQSLALFDNGRSTQNNTLRKEKHENEVIRIHEFVKHSNHAFILGSSTVLLMEKSLLEVVPLEEKSRAWTLLGIGKWKLSQELSAWRIGRSGSLTFGVGCTGRLGRANMHTISFKKYKQTLVWHCTYKGQYAWQQFLYFTLSLWSVEINMLLYMQFTRRLSVFITALRSLSLSLNCAASARQIHTWKDVFSGICEDTSHEHNFDIKKCLYLAPSICLLQYFGTVERKHEPVVNFCELLLFGVAYLHTIGKSQDILVW